MWYPCISLYNVTLKRSLSTRLIFSNSITLLSEKLVTLYSTSEVNDFSLFIAVKTEYYITLCKACSYLITKSQLNYKQPNADV